MLFALVNATPIQVYSNSLTGWIANNREASTFSQALQNYQIRVPFQANVTLFVPTDQAFTNQMASWDLLQDQPLAVRALLLYHISSDHVEFDGQQVKVRPLAKRQAIETNVLSSTQSPTPTDSQSAVPSQTVTESVNPKPSETSGPSQSVHPKPSISASTTKNAQSTEAAQPTGTAQNPETATQEIKSLLFGLKHRIESQSGNITIDKIPAQRVIQLHCKGLCVLDQKRLDELRQLQQQKQQAKQKRGSKHATMLQLEHQSHIFSMDAGMLVLPPMVPETILGNQKIQIDFLNMHPHCAGILGTELTEDILNAIQEQRQDRPLLDTKQKTQSCQSSGFVVGKQACQTCNTRGFVHQSQETHDVAENLRCFFCKDCPVCKGLGVENIKKRKPRDSMLL
ncbi:hypothetical protein EDD86DRAFT_247539 [Gorgonomyces haynaldii]|nr:hypothetical protein EDD86DRAFT_247539 [Gorgonomyces haynaldii]